MGGLGNTKPETAAFRKPSWLKVRLPGGEKYSAIRGMMRGSHLHTVCEEAKCPNLGECWKSGTATFMILGDTCTRACGYCNVRSGVPGKVDDDEPKKVARAVRKMGLKYAVVTSVTRDDLPDGGAGIFAETIREIRKTNPRCRIEVLIPYLEGKALRKVLDAGPGVLSHNIEVVRRLFPQARPKGDYEKSLRLLENVKLSRPNILTKSGFMLGLGETEREIAETMKDLRKAKCDLLTIGQYLQPARRHLPVRKYYHPDEFRKLRKAGEKMGFLHVEAGPLVRSSYMAERYVKMIKAKRT